MTEGGANLQPGADDDGEIKFVIKY